MQRRQFLRGRSTPEPIRPPWSKEEKQFITQCQRCNQCIVDCPQKIIVTGDGGFPEVNFMLGECDFCQQCLTACSYQAFDKSLKPPWKLSLKITSHCLITKKVSCFTCMEQCPKAVFQIPIGQFILQANDTLCSGCGACIAPCPTHAIQLIREYTYNDSS